MMMKSAWIKNLGVLFFLVAFLFTPLLALACPSCGCSELCPVTMMDENVRHHFDDSLLSNTIWGNLILKMAYERDLELQKLRRADRGVNLSTSSVLAAAAAGTLGQGVVAIATYNPPAGVPDSYVPGIIGLALEGAVNTALWSRIGLKSHVDKKIRNRELVLRGKVESILQHLEFSNAKCEEARQDLFDLIGDKAAQECLNIWQPANYSIAVTPNTGG